LDAALAELAQGQAIQALVNIGVSASRIDTWSVAEMKYVCSDQLYLF
jgi:hypothetical protein